MENQEVYGIIYLATNIQNRKVYVGQTYKKLESAITEFIF